MPAPAAAARSSPGVETLDLEGARLVPAFRDAHVHLAAGSLEIGRLDLRGSSSEDDVLRLVAAHAASLPSGAWVRGFGWSGEHGLSPAALDRAASGRPVALARADGHALRLGAAAMRILGIDGGDGLLVERAADEARARIPADGEAERRAAVASGLALAARHGLASVDDVVEPWALPRYLVRREMGTLSCRVRIASG